LGVHGSEHQDRCAFGCDTGYFGKRVSTFRKNLLLPSLGHNGSAALKSQTAGLFETSAHMSETIAVVSGSSFTVYKEYFLPVTKIKFLMIFGAQNNYWL